MKWIPGTQTQVAQTGEDKMLRYTVYSDSICEKVWENQVN